MKFTILSHAGIEITQGDCQLVCDPWLLGSCYWGSWWNYPPVSEALIESLHPDFIYITHFHWDHFQSPSIKRLGVNKTFLIPEEPCGRMKKDLLDIGCTDIIELPHGKKYSLKPGFTITSYHFGHHMTDSALVIESGGVTLLNANDAKLMGPPLKHLLKQHPSIDFVLRSHSSANPRLCFEIIEEPGMLTDDLQGYIRDFVDFSKAVDAKYAIPFASNQCYLHPQTFKYNKYGCTPDMVKAYADRENLEHPEVVVMVSGDSWSTETGFDIKEQTWFSEKDKHLKEYLESVDTRLKETAVKESRASMNLAQMERYFKPLLDASPWLLRRAFKGKPFLYRLRHGDEQELLYIVDIHKKTITEAVPEDVDRILRQVIADAAIIRKCVAKKIFSHLGISKRVIYRTTSEDRWLFEVFFTMITAFENNLFPLRNILTLRFFRCWFKRRREILLYMQIVLRKIRGKGISYSDLLKVYR